MKFIAIQHWWIIINYYDSHVHILQGGNEEKCVRMCVFVFQSNYAKKSPIIFKVYFLVSLHERERTYSGNQDLYFLFLVPAVYFFTYK